MRDHAAEPLPPSSTPHSRGSVEAPAADPAAPGSIAARLRGRVAAWLRRRRWAHTLAVRMYTIWNRCRWRLGISPFIRPRDYRRWIERYEALDDGDRQAIREAIQQFSTLPRFQLLLAVAGNAEESVRQTLLSLRSLRRQLYPHWEVRVFLPGNVIPQLRDALTAEAAADARIQFQEIPATGDFISALNAGLRESETDLIALMNAGDELAEHALYLAADALQSQPDTDLIYTDEDRFDRQRRRCDPCFKTGFDPDLMRSRNQFGRLCLFRCELARQTGGFREEFAECLEYDLALRCLERTSAERIRHLPHVLYHAAHLHDTAAANLHAIRDHLARTLPTASVSIAPRSRWPRVRFPLPADAPLVSVIIPTKDRVDLLDRCLTGLLHATDYPHLEVLIVDNRSLEPRTADYLRKLDSPTVRVLSYDAPFNYAAINNFAAKQARGELLCLLNNDIEVIEPGWLEEMVSQALRLEVGAVGAKLLFPDSTLQHAGVALGPGGDARHVHARLPREIPAPFGETELVRNVSAVTAACLVLRRAVFDEVGGFDEETFPIRYNDIDLCLRIRERGYRILWTPFAELYHWESLSVRRSEAAERNMQREVEAFRQRWASVIRRDPYHSPNRSLVHTWYRLANPPRSECPWREAATTSPGDALSDTLPDNQSTRDPLRPGSGLLNSNESTQTSKHG